MGGRAGREIPHRQPQAVEIFIIDQTRPRSSEREDADRHETGLELVVDPRQIAVAQFRFDGEFAITEKLIFTKTTPA